MHRLARTTVAAAAAFAFLVTAGCFEVTEQYHFNPDGSGKVVFDVGLGQQLAAFAESEGGDPWAEMRENFEKAKTEAESDPNITTVTLEEKDVADMHRFIITAQVKDMTKAKDSMQNIGGEDDSPGDTQLSITRSGDAFAFNRAIKMGNDEEPENPGAAALMKSMFAGRYYTVQVHGAGVSAQGGEAKEGYVEFRKSLVEMMSSKGAWTIDATVPAGGGGGMTIWIVVGGLVLVVVGLVIAMSGKKKSA